MKGMEGGSTYPGIRHRRVAQKDMLTYMLLPRRRLLRCFRFDMRTSPFDPFFNNSVGLAPRFSCEDTLAPSLNTIPVPFVNTGGDL